MSKTNETLETIFARRSHRQFLSDPVEREDLETVIQAAAHAPSPLNNQPWRFIVIENRETIAKIADFVKTQTESIRDRVLKGAMDEYNEYCKNAVFFAEAPALIIVLLKPIDNDSKGRLWGVPGFFKNERRARGDIMSIGAACQNLMLAAESLGLCTCMMLYPLIADEDVRELLDIRIPWEIMAYFPIGKKVEQNVALPKRRNTARIVEFV